MNKTFISDEIMHGNPSLLEETLQREIANQILKMNGKDYENVCFNMRLYAHIFELLEKHINDEFIVLKHNPMGSWYIETDKLEIYYYKNEEIAF